MCGQPARCHGLSASRSPRRPTLRPLLAGELAWLFLGLVTAVLYAVASAGRGFGTPKSRVALFQVLPLAGALLLRLRPEAFCK